MSSYFYNVEQLNNVADLEFENIIEDLKEAHNEINTLKDKNGFLEDKILDLKQVISNLELLIENLELEIKETNV